MKRSLVTDLGVGSGLSLAWPGWLCIGSYLMTADCENDWFWTTNRPGCDFTNYLGTVTKLISVATPTRIRVTDPT